MNAMAAMTDGDTIHHAFKVGFATPSSADGAGANDDEDELQELETHITGVFENSWKNVKVLFIHEISMVAADLFANAEARARCGAVRSIGRSTGGWVSCRTRS